MDVVKVVGMRAYDFQDEKGQSVKGMKYHVLRIPENSDHLGYEVASFSVSERNMLKWQAAKAFIPSLGDVCTVNYNRYGRLDKFEIVDEPGDVFKEFLS